MPFSISIPGPHTSTEITANEGKTVIFVGANGGGKTRLAVLIERTFGSRSHRIAAHRALKLNPSVAKISKEWAIRGLKTGYAPQFTDNRDGNRWGGKAETSILDDYDFIVQALFADQSNTALESHKNARAGNYQNIAYTNFEKLVEIWDKILPHRKLYISGDDIEVSSPSSQSRYKASDMSDGERAIFYILGQVLVADANSLLIFDEPELHVHRAILGQLWDEIESVRPDCAFVLITHDLDFAASRIADKFVISEYSPVSNWSIEAVPEDSGFSEEITTLILGSRKPILFVEGASTSLDRMIYRACYPEWTVIPRQSCEQVIHAVATMRTNKNLTRITCFGIVDADDHDAAHLAGLGVAALPVSEIENLILLPDVSRAILEKEGYVGAELDSRLNALMCEVFKKIDEPDALERVVARHCRRRIDRTLKKIDLSSASSVADIAEEYRQQTAALDVAAVGAAVESQIRDAVKSNNLPGFLKVYDDKAFVAIAAKHLKSTSASEFKSWLARMLLNDSIPALTAAIRGHIPAITA
ncbi:AAA family ATPase [Methylobacterium sp. Leaf93]|uniref:AAA family ATPase n=1 Tax=Methylobacterium sp. Leaf93 TaxID=1736249 RepID=UPI0009E6E06F|nr:AAA family ATPase [Methylobacterium sp. Leaf93]